MKMKHKKSKVLIVMHFCKQMKMKRKKSKVFIDMHFCSFVFARESHPYVQAVKELTDLWAKRIRYVFCIFITADSYEENYEI